MTAGEAVLVALGEDVADVVAAEDRVLEGKLEGVATADCVCTEVPEGDAEAELEPVDVAVLAAE